MIPSGPFVCLFVTGVETLPVANANIKSLATGLSWKVAKGGSESQKTMLESVHIIEKEIKMSTPL